MRNSGQERSEKNPSEILCLDLLRLLCGEDTARALLTQIGAIQLRPVPAGESLELLMRQNDIYECYNPNTGEPPPRAASVFGWSSAVFVDLAIHASRG